MLLIRGSVFDSRRLYGVMCAQTARYFTQRNEDERAFKTVVSLIFISGCAACLSLCVNIDWGPMVRPIGMYLLRVLGLTQRSRAVDTAQIVSVAYSLYFYLITGRTVEVPGPGVVRVW